MRGFQVRGCVRVYKVCAFVRECKVCANCVGVCKLCAFVQSVCKVCALSKVGVSRTCQDGFIAFGLSLPSLQVC